ncbi:MAG TPA: phosphoribosylanthranilate isomerase [Candidatus Aphodoplasma excrementigallinarum]|uniref:N-(5'-phosphoribosyl)anthranilate isomerase n=1 Tax=Candidatus Aphodoplasma excrementigallinarum TaxID=2840673 RepID=A0A9D1SZR5_9FIRM|nr:phosphoribosylanthranilate isomerase [Candidatus Aphodoplasma excrementigallinarum]
MTKIKLCGLWRPCDIEYANALMPDFIGFVFAPKSKRYVSFAQAQLLRRRLREGITPVGVFVNAPAERIEYLVKQHVISVVQLHGSEDNGFIKTLRSRVDCPVIQAFHIAGAHDVQKAEKSEADFVMLDSGGGTGQSFDHSAISGIKREFFLAGGLDSENVGEAIAKYKPYCVDASSSLETDGVKDRNKMAAFVNAVRYGGKVE